MNNFILNIIYGFQHLKQKKKGRKITYKISGVSSPMNNKIRHVANEVSCQSQVE